MSKLWKPDNAGKILPVVYVRPLLPPPPQFSARVQPQHLHWQLGRYKEDLTFGPGGRGRKKRWVVQQEAEQHNMVLTQTYDNLIGQYGFIALNDYAVVGTGSTPPNSSQTGLANEVRRTRRDQNGNTSGTRTITRPADGVYAIEVTREFAETEVGNLNLTEWGFSPAGSAGNNLISRELFRDGNGNPIVITPASDQRLRLIYKIQVAFGPQSTPVSININGIGVRTGVFYFNGGPMNFDIYQGPNDLYWADQIARGDATNNSIHVGVFSIYVPSQYTAFPPNTSEGPLKAISFAPITRGRKINPVVFNSNEANRTIRSIALARFGGWVHHGINLSSGQEFTKTNLYKLTIGEWTFTWGP